MNAGRTKTQMFCLDQRASASRSAKGLTRAKDPPCSEGRLAEVAFALFLEKVDWKILFEPNS